MKTILFLLVLAGIGYSFLSKPEISEQVQIHLAAIQRHALEIAKEKASEVINQQLKENGEGLSLPITLKQESNPAPAMLYTSKRITESSTAGVRSIPEGTPVQILQMSGDQVTVTDGKVVVTTTPDSITDTAPAEFLQNNTARRNLDVGPDEASANRDPVQEFLDAQSRTGSLPPSVTPAPPVFTPAPASPPSAAELHNRKLQIQIDGIDEQIAYLQQEINAARERDYMARIYGNSSSHRVTITRHNMEIQRLQNRKHNLLRQMRY